MILFAGDTHGDQRWLGRVAKRTKPAAIVHLGDIQLEEPATQALADVWAHTRFFWVSGNHDYDSLEYYDRLNSPNLASGGLHGRVVALGGVRIAGLGGWFQEKIWLPPRNTSTAAKRSALRNLHSKRSDLRLAAARASGAIHWEDFETLRDLRADVLVCHEAPSCHRHGFDLIDNLARAMGVQKIFHGHHHETYRATLSGGIEVFGVGLRAIVDIDGNVIHRGDSDTRSSRRQGKRGSP